MHEQDFPEEVAEYNRGLTPVFDRLQQIKGCIQVAIEAQIKAKAFNKNNEAVVRVTLPADEDAAVLELLRDREFAKEYFIVADVEVCTGEALAAEATKTPYAMCPRCRRYEPAVNEEGLCARCADAMAARA